MIVVDAVGAAVPEQQQLAAEGSVRVYERSPDEVVPEPVDIRRSYSHFSWKEM